MKSSGGLTVALPKQYGVTKPLSTAGPTVTDLQRSRELERVCLCISCITFFFIVGLGEQIDIRYSWSEILYVLCCSFWLMLGCTKARRKLPRERRFFVASRR